MTLIHTILTNRFLRNRIPVTPSRPHGWPVDTVHTSEDVLIGGCSLVELATTRGTPAVLIHPAGHPESPRGAAAYITVVIVRVLAVTADPHGVLRIRTDGILTKVTPDWAGSTVLGRPASANRVCGTVEADGAAPLPAAVPEGIRGDDLLAVPIAGTIALSTVRRQHRTVADEGDATDTWMRCGK